MESAGVGDLGVEVGDLGHRLLPEPPPGGSCGRGRGVGHQKHLEVEPPRGSSARIWRIFRWDSEIGDLETSGQEFPLTSCPGHWFGLETSGPNTSAMVKSPGWVWCKKSNYISSTFHPWTLGDLNPVLYTGLGEERKGSGFR